MTTGTPETTDLRSGVLKMLEDHLSADAARDAELERLRLSVPDAPTPRFAIMHRALWEPPRSTNLAEITTARDFGVDAFAPDIPSPGATGSGAAWPKALGAAGLIEAARQLEFPLIPCADGNGTGLNQNTPEHAAKYLAQLCNHTLGGRTFLTCFKAEGPGTAGRISGMPAVEFWPRVVAEMEKILDRDVEFMACISTASDANLAAFAKIATVLSTWGSSWPQDVTAGTDYVAKAHDREREWMQPIRFQDVRGKRPQDQVYADAEASSLLRAGFAQANAGDGGKGAEFLNAISWDDTAETPMRDTPGILPLWRDLVADWKARGVTTVARDRVTLITRPNPAKASKLRNRLGLATSTADRPTRDEGEVVVAATGPRILEVTQGASKIRRTIGPGLTPVPIPYADGTTSVRLLRGSTQVAAASSSSSSSPAKPEAGYRVVSDPVS